MFKLVAFCLIIACATAYASTAAVATPLLAKIVPQPQAPANTEHAAHVAAPLPILHYAPLTYASYGGYTPLPYAGKYLTYSQPLHASSYFISY